MGVAEHTRAAHTQASRIDWVWGSRRACAEDEHVSYGPGSTSDAQVKLFEGGVSLHWQAADCAAGAARILRPGSSASRCDPSGMTALAAVMGCPAWLNELLQSFLAAMCRCSTHSARDAFTEAFRLT